MERLRWLARVLVVGLVACGPPARETPDTGPPTLPEEAPTAETSPVERFPHREAFFGDLHVHTSWATDAFFYGNRVGPRDAWRFARGEAVRLPTGIVAQLATPLDFAAITDHAEGFDRIGICTDPDHAMYATQACEDMRNPKVDIDEFFARALAQAVRWPRPRSPALCADLDACPVAARATWRRTQTAADAFDRPGEFTALIGYEFTGMLPGAGMLHRNVLFRNGHVAEDAISSNDVVNQSDFFGQLDAACQPPCEVLTIPHNTNFSWGLMFAGADWDGGEYTEADLERRLRIDRVVEVTRRKGSSECQVGVGATDEDLPADLGAWSDPLETAYAGGVPMGGDLEGEDPRTFWAWAAQDPDAATLRGVLGRAPTRRGWALCTLTATVDTATCERHDDPGAAELEATFTDPAFRPDQHASTMSA